MNWTIMDGDYYISPTSGLDTNNGTKNAPFKTIQQALAYDYNNGNIAWRKFVLEGGIYIVSQSFAYTSRTAKKFICDGDRAVIVTPTGFVSGDYYTNFTIMSAANLCTSRSTPSPFYINCHILDSYISQQNSSYFYYCLINNLRRGTDDLFNAKFFGNNNTVVNSPFMTSGSGSFKCGFNSSIFINCSKPVGFDSSTFLYNVIPDSWTISGLDATNKLLGSVTTAFVNESLLNYNILVGSSLINAGKPDLLTMRPTHIGCGKLVSSFNGSNLGGIHSGTAFDVDNSLILNVSKAGIFTSDVLDIGSLKLIRSIPLNQLKEWTAAGMPMKFCGGTKWYKYLPVSGASANTLTMPLAYLVADDSFTTSPDTYVRITSGTGSTFTRNPSASASSGQAVVSVTNTAGIYVGQSITGTGIAAGTLVASIIDNTSITLSANLTSGLTTSSVLTFQQPRNQVTALDATTGVMSLSANWQVTPDSTSMFEFYRLPVSLTTFELRWSSVSAADVQSKTWCKMVIGQDIRFSANTGTRYGNGDDSFDSVYADYVRARYFQVSLKLHDLSY